MNKRITSLLILSVFIIFGLSAQSTVKLLDRTFNVDTLFHAQVGPGVTQTSLKLSGPADLRVFYITADLTNPTLSLRAISAGDKVPALEVVSQMAKRKSNDNVSYIAGCNADFYVMRGKTSNGTSNAGTTTSAAIIDGDIFKTSNSAQQFIVDRDGVPYIGRLDLEQSTIKIGDKTFLCKGINRDSFDDAITLYTSKYYGITDEPEYEGKCVEVPAKLVSGDVMSPGRVCRLEITGNISYTGNRAVPDRGYVLMGRGTAAEAMKNLKIGDIVTYDNKAILDGKEIEAFQVVSGNPRPMADGKVIDTEKERPDACNRHPRTGIGYGDNKTKVVIMVIDGRSPISIGVRTSELGEMMRYAGATDAVNLDGGGSSTLYTSALGVRNVTSDGHERPVANGIFVGTTAAKDKEIAEIRFEDWAVKLTEGEKYIPRFFGYNKDGMLVDTDVKGVTLNCDSSVGSVVENSAFVAAKNGMCVLNAQLNGMKTSVVVTVK